jgi:hypothetical protein
MAHLKAHAAIEAAQEGTQADPRWNDWYKQLQQGTQQDVMASTTV